MRTGTVSGIRKHDDYASVEIAHGDPKDEREGGPSKTATKSSSVCMPLEEARTIAIGDVVEIALKPVKRSAAKAKLKNALAKTKSKDEAEEYDDEA